MAIRQIRIEGDPILRKKSREVSDIDDRIREIAKDMAETMYENNGLGLAAVQVGLLKRIVVVDFREGEGIMTLINPEIVERSEEENIDLEGCLSVPNRSEYVKRPKRVVVEYTDLDGNRKSYEATDYNAHCICHELDHLDGVLYVDDFLKLSQEEALEFNKEQEEKYETENE
ncbi:MAG: peptide deformylase [Finegoldia sp.]|nr:peptide deformylase [Finegoldia sp.]